jgi:hypothetical protein
MAVISTFFSCAHYTTHGRPRLAFSEGRYRDTGVYGGKPRAGEIAG